MEYKKYSLEHFRKVISQIFYGRGTDDNSSTVWEVDRFDKVKSKILEGYCYQIGNQEKVEGERNILAHTGYGGAKSFVDTCRVEGISDAMIEKMIFCYTDMGKLPLSALTVKKKDDGNE